MSETRAAKELRRSQRILSNIVSLTHLKRKWRLYTWRMTSSETWRLKVNDNSRRGCVCTLMGNAPEVTTSRQPNSKLGRRILEPCHAPVYIYPNRALGKIDFPGLHLPLLLSVLLHAVKACGINVMEVLRAAQIMLTRAESSS
jgi:hypothetical protein